MIILGLLIFSLSELIFGLGTHVSIFYFSRILGGVSAAFIMPAVTAYVADITTLKERSKAMGYVSAAISTGFIIGALVREDLLPALASACRFSSPPPSR